PIESAPAPTADSQGEPSETKDQPRLPTVVRTVKANEQDKELLAPPHPLPDSLATPDASAAFKRETLPIDLPTALRLADAANPTINLARERVREAYFLLNEAEVAWLPNLQTGPTYVRHDGQLQNAAGVVFGVSKQNLF